MVRLPVTGALAQQSQSFSSRLLWAACCVGFFGFLQCGEFLIPDDGTFTPETHLALDDILFTEHRGMPAFHPNIKASKTDQFRDGAVVVLAAI